MRAKKFETARIHFLCDIAGTRRRRICRVTAVSSSTLSVQPYGQTPLTDTEGAIESVRINGVSVLNGLNSEKM